MCGFLTLGRKEFMNPGDFERTFIKAEDSAIKKGLSVEEVTGEGLGSVLCLAP